MEISYGHIDGIKIGQIFETRQALIDAGMHPHREAGIWGSSKNAACSIVLSGGYEDDLDELDFVLYTGHGGQKNKVQVADQDFSAKRGWGNKGLVISYESNLPVRVIRGYQIDNGPTSGYRYDGLYYVEKYERVRGKSGYFVCRFYLRSELQIQPLENKLKSNLKKTYKSAPRAKSTVDRTVRSQKNVDAIKKMYLYRCQVCGIQLDVPDRLPICIGAHIKGIGFPTRGPDEVENMLCLCPNHHDQFDAFAFTINPENLKIIGLNEFNAKKIQLNKKHNIDKQFLQYHFDEYEKHY